MKKFRKNNAERQYNDGCVVFETEYKYDNSANRVEEFKKFSKTKKIFEYNTLRKVSEELEYKANEKYWYSRKKYSYDDKTNLIETLIYNYPEKNIHNAKIICSYDTKVSLIKSTECNLKRTCFITNLKCKPNKTYSKN